MLSKACTLENGIVLDSPEHYGDCTSKWKVAVAGRDTCRKYKIPYKRDVVELHVAECTKLVDLAYVKSDLATCRNARGLALELCEVNRECGALRQTILSGCKSSRLDIARLSAAEQRCEQAQRNVATLEAELYSCRRRTRYKLTDVPRCLHSELSVSVQCRS